MKVQTLLSEESLRLKGFSKIAGVDEAGRGPLAGPVVAAACILPLIHSIQGIKDSKELDESTRERLYQKLVSTPQVHFGVGIVDAQTIDEVNILQATFLAMQIAVMNLNIEPDYLLVDGNRLPKKDKFPSHYLNHPKDELPFFKIKASAIIKGDQLSQSIGAASIIAKVIRDRLMREYDLKWPMYLFKENKGYGTEAHRKAIDQHGPCPIHRKTFEPLKRSIYALQHDRIWK